MYNSKAFWLFSSLLFTIGFQNCNALEAQRGLAEEPVVQRAALTQNVPLEAGYDIVIVAGQSNAVGRAFDPDLNSIPSHLRKDHLEDRVFQVGRFDGNNGETILAEPPLHFNYPPQANRTSQEVFDIAKSEGRTGFAYNFGLRLAHQLPGRRKVLLVPVARGGTSILQWSHYEDEELNATSELFYDMMRSLRQALNSPLPNSNRVGQNRVVAMIWQQGEADLMAHTGINHPYRGTMTVNLYKKRLRLLFKVMRNVLRRNYGITDNFPILVGEMSREISPHGETYSSNEHPTLEHLRAHFRQVQGEVAAQDACARVVGSRGLNTMEANTHLHFAQDSLNRLAYRYLVRFLEAYDSCY